FQQVLNSVDAVRDDLQVREQKLLPELSQLVREVPTREAVQDDQQAARVAEDAQPPRIVAPLRRHQAGRVQKLDGGGGGLFRIEVGGQPAQPLVRDLGDSELADIRLTWVW